MTAHQRMRGKAFSHQIAAFEAKILFKPYKTAGPEQKVRCELIGRLLARENTRTGNISWSTMQQWCRTAASGGETRKNAGYAVSHTQNFFECATWTRGSRSQLGSTGRTHSEAEPTVLKTLSEECGGRIHITMVSDFGETLGCLMVGQPHTEE